MQKTDHIIELIRNDDTGICNRSASGLKFTPSSVQESRTANVAIAQFAIIETPKPRTHRALYRIVKLQWKCRCKLASMLPRFTWCVSPRSFTSNYVIVINRTVSIKSKTQTTVHDGRSEENKVIKINVFPPHQSSDHLAKGYTILSLVQRAI